jgi:hypothetical protein
VATWNYFLLADLLCALDLFVMERRPDSTFSAMTPPPAWLAKILRSEAADGPITLATVFPFLEGFLDEAGAVWVKGTASSLVSPTFTAESDSEQMLLRATAVNVGPTCLLVIERLTGEADPRAVLQKARDNKLQQEQLQRRVASAQAPIRSLADLVNELLATDLAPAQRKLAEDIGRAAARAQAAAAGPPPAAGS